MGNSQVCGESCGEIFWSVGRVEGISQVCVGEIRDFFVFSREFRGKFICSLGNLGKNSPVF